MSLTDIAIRSVKPQSTPYKIADSAGLYLLVMPNSSKLWRFDYRFGGKRKTIALGKYPIKSLAEARRARDTAKELVEKRIDPSEKRKLDKLALNVAAGNTFEAVAEEWLQKIEREGRAEVTLKKSRWFVDLMNPTLGARPIAAISVPELLLALRKTEARGKYECQSASNRNPGSACKSDPRLVEVRLQFQQHVDC